MAFEVRVEEADGTVVATYDHRYRIGDRWVDLWIESILPDYRDPAYRLPGNLDPYGDTIFNGWQVDNLIGELEGLDTDAEDIERRETIRRMRDCVLSANGRLTGD